jgi:hypothetical protein
MGGLTERRSSGGELGAPASWIRLVPASPGLIALVWAIAALLDIENTLLFPSLHVHWVSSTLCLSGASIFAGLLAGWVLRLGRSTLPLVGALISVRLVASLASVALKLVTPASVERYVGGIIGCLWLLASALTIYLAYGASRSRTRRIMAVALAIGVSVCVGAILNLDGSFRRLSVEIQPLLGRQEAQSPSADPSPDIDGDVLWGAQPALPGRTNVYAMAVAGSGEQALFSREAREALRVAALRFGDDSRGGALLSNGAADLLQSPLATRANIAAVAQAIGRKADHKRDLLFVYLVSHGSRTAELESDLPDYGTVQPISSATTAAALKGAGVARKVVVISACFSATWIPALADDDTIVITAAAKDRTSFGCDDSRRFTVFGEAFLGSLALKNLSLHDVFDDAKRKISAEELREKVTPSTPQAFVGRNMESLWLGQPDGAFAQAQRPGLRGWAAKPLGPN